MELTGWFSGLVTEHGAWYEAATEVRRGVRNKRVRSKGTERPVKEAGTGDNGGVLVEIIQVSKDTERSLH